MENSYIYRHLKPNGEVFYIGIGTGNNFKRSREKNKRTIHWKNIVNKYGYEVQILKKNISREEAIELEILLIDYYGRKDLGKGTLCNLTDGGEGVVGSIHSEETKLKIGLKSKGRKHSEESRKYQREIRKEDKNPFYGKKHSEETKESYSKLYSGKNSPNAKLVLDTQTGIFYYCVQEAADAFNTKKKTLLSWLNGQRPNKSNLIYV